MDKIVNFIKENQFLKFAVTGALGTITNLTLFFLLVDLLKLPGNLIIFLTFIISASQNYVINHLWTFKGYCSSHKISIKKWSQFIVTSLLGLSVNYIFYNLIMLIFIPQYKVIAQACGILMGMIINFLGSKYFVFKLKQ